jgi:hypothetical protein
MNVQMNNQISNTQYFFKVDLQQPESDLRGVAMLGHQTLSELHDLISSRFERIDNGSFSFSRGDSEISSDSRLDELSLRVGQTLTYRLGAVNEAPFEVTVDFIDAE